jgi:hypothetical protein
VQIDGIRNNPQKYTKDMLIRHDLKSFLDIKSQLCSGDYIGAYNQCSSMNNAFVWKLVAKEALKARMYDISKKCFAKCNCFSSIVFINRVSLLDVLTSINL